MNLTTFMALPEVKDRLKREYELPKIQCTKNIQVERRTSHKMLPGTAFDYLMRFWIQTLNPNAETHGWVADNWMSLEMVGATVAEKKKIEKLLQDAKACHSDYLKTGKLTDNVISATIELARLDAISRAQYLDPNIGILEKPLVEELRNMLELANSKDFTASSYCALNPTFGKESLLRADADLIIDDTLIDIKTTTKGKMDRSHFNQLIGYFILNELGKVNGKKIKINRLGIYFSRYGELLTFPAETVVGDKFPDFVEWFRKTAELHP